MRQQTEKTVTANFCQATPTPKCDQGAVQRVDTVGREIIVLLRTGLALFDVPGECLIFLRGEPIKLRVVQPGDQVRITFADHQGMLIAKLLEVQPDTGFACFRL